MQNNILKTSVKNDRGRAANSASSDTLNWKKQVCNKNTECIFMLHACLFFMQQFKVFFLQKGKAFMNKLIEFKEKLYYWQPKNTHNIYYKNKFEINLNKNCVLVSNFFKNKGVANV